MGEHGGEAGVRAAVEETGWDVAREAAQVLRGGLGGEGDAAAVVGRGNGCGKADKGCAVRMRQAGRAA